MQHGWEYLPSYMGFTAIYLVGFWFAAKAWAKLSATEKTLSRNIA
jgi:uncharacterized Rossmann fold enzyme